MARMVYDSDNDKREVANMAARREVTGTLERVERMRSSANGNPRFAVTIDAGGTYSETYQTGVDASVAYEVTNYKMGRRVTLTLEGKRENIVNMTDRMDA